MKLSVMVAVLLSLSVSVFATDPSLTEKEWDQVRLESLAHDLWIAAYKARDEVRRANDNVPGGCSRTSYYLRMVGQANGRFDYALRKYAKSQKTDNAFLSILISQNGVRQNANTCFMSSYGSELVVKVYGIISEMRPYFPKSEWSE